MSERNNSSGVAPRANNRLLVFDLGAHRGADTSYYLARGFKVVAIEPNPQMAEKLKELGPESRLLIECRALSASAGQIPLHLPLDDRADCWATTSGAQVDMLSKAGVRTRVLQVPTVTLQDLVDRHGTPYYIKCDIEGTDTVFLQLLAELNPKPATISVELSQISVPAMWAQLKALYRCGYRRFYIRDQAKLPHALFVEGEIRTLPGMWSGPFGVEIDDGSSLSFNQLRRRAVAIALRNRLFGEFGLLGRWHLYALFKRLSRFKPFRPIAYTSWFDIHCFLH